MPSGKKAKKKWQKTQDLVDFLDVRGTTPTVPIKPLSWADDVEDDHHGTYTPRSSKEPVVLPTAPRAARDPRGMDDDVPTSPPFVASLSNLPYDVDEDYLTEFFADMKIVNIRLPKDSTKLKGYGYIEFEDRQSLIDALNLPNTSMKTRRVRIDVMNSSNDDRRGGRMGRDNRRDGYDDPERTSGDWRSGPRDSPADGDSYRSRYDNRDRDRRDDREASDFDNNKPGGWRENTDRGRPMMRDRGGFRDDDKDREWSRYDRGSRDRDGDRRSNFGPRRNYGEAEYDRDADSRSRPKLQLQPRTKPVEAGADQPIKDDPPSAPATASAPAAAPAPPPANTPAPARASSPTSAPAPAPAPAPTPASAHAPASAPSTNIFGAARPVDTAAREREIEERLAKLNSESKFRDERDGDPEKRGKEGTWGRRNGEGRDDKEKDRGRLAWRTEDDRGRRNERSAPQSQPAHSDQYADSRGPPSFRSGPPLPKGPQRSNDTRGSDRDRKDREKDDASRMSKTKDDQAPNFVASNKYSMLPDDVDPDNIDD
ncbi:eukaryotic translation initiation factor 4B isoform X2 [Lasioglossum baleicum]|uniref:eukaryotic translation initiation factor 4B isoform X2 n=1 Tax=Lasioglossum baleicum TaxID=434251 RepID=UPI003FCDCA38